MFYIMDPDRKFFSYFDNNIPVFSYYPDDCPMFTNEAEATYYSNLINNLGYKNEIIKM